MSPLCTPAFPVARRDRQVDMGRVISPAPSWRRNFIGERDQAAAGIP